MKSTGPEPQFVKNLFAEISGTYDTANDAITFGMARLWRKTLVDWSDLPTKSSSVALKESTVAGSASTDFRILDCATGTGDLAIEFKKIGGDRVHVIGSDFCAEMLEYAPLKAQKKNCNVTFEVADVTNLPYGDSTFDVVSIAYGIRNVGNRLGGITEMARVLKPGGRLMILETGEVENPALRKMIRFYFEKCVPRLGGLVSGRRDAYEYLQKSSGAFPSGQDFVRELETSGCFTRVEYKPIMGGASFIYKATK